MPKQETGPSALFFCSSSSRLALLLLLVALALAFPDNAVAEQFTVDEPLPKISAQYDYYGGTARLPGNFGGFGGGQYGGGPSLSDTVNFDFQCKCQAKSALARSLLNTQNPSGSDPNSSSQQQIQQLQEQVRKLQEQINRSQQGKTPFEQFAQMLSLADGLDCNCSGQSTPWSGWPSGVAGGGNGAFPNAGRGGLPLSQVVYPGGGGQFIGGGQFPFPPTTMVGGMGAGGVRPPMAGMGGGHQLGGGPFHPFGGGGGGGQSQHLYPGYPLRTARQA